MKIQLTIGMVLLSSVLLAQNGEVARGNRYFKEGDFDKAEQSYRKALSKKSLPAAQYNLGNTLYKKNKVDDAIASYEQAVNTAADAETKSKALYNKGVLYHKNNRFEEAVTAYKEALRLTPDDAEIRKNLQLALMAQRKQKEPQEQKPKQQEQKPKEDNQKKPEEPKPQKSKLSQKQAEQYLKALEQKERELQEKMHKKTAVPSQPEKDW